MSDEEGAIQKLDLLNNKMFGSPVIGFSNEWVEEKKRRQIDCDKIPFQTKKTKEMKMLFRKGISDDSRRRWWFVLSGGFELYQEVGDIYQNGVEVVSKLENLENNSTFGVTFDLLEFLPPQFSETLPTFLKVISYYNRQIEYSPLIPVISAMLLMYLEPPLAYLSMQSMINKSIESLYYIVITKEQFCLQIGSIQRLICSRLPNLARHTQKLNIKLSELLYAIFPSFFIPFLSYPSSLTICDSFISEGRKVLFRFTLEILLEEESNLLLTKDKPSFVRILFNSIEKLSHPDILAQFMQKAFKLKIKRKEHIERIEKSSKLNLAKQECLCSLGALSDFTKMMLYHPESRTRANSTISHLNNRDHPDLLDIPSDLTETPIENPPEPRMPIREPSHEDIINSELDMMISMQKQIARSTLPAIIGYTDDLILTESILLSMRSQIPTVFSHYSAELVYKLSIDGASFTSLFSQCSHLGQYILLIKTKRSVIGAFLSDPMIPDAPKYYGTPMTFVFNATKNMYFKLKKPVNDYYISVSHDCIMLGGPRAAIYFSDKMDVVMSDECETFGSPRLTKKDYGDKILDIEVYRYALIMNRDPRIKKQRQSHVILPKK